MILFCRQGIVQYLLPVASLAGAAHLIGKNKACMPEERSPEASAEKAPRLAFSPRTAGEIVAGVLFGLSFAVLFLFLRLEVGVDLAGRRLFWLTGVNVVWICACIAALVLLRKGIPGWWQIILGSLLGCTILRGVIDFFNMAFWGWGAPFVWSQCFGAVCNTAVLVSGILLCGRLMPRGRLERVMNLVCRIAWPVLLFLHATREWGIIIRHKLPGLTGGGISVLWALFAFVMVFRGVTTENRYLRHIGLGLFAVVVCKVFLFDLAHLDAIYRVLAFFAFGVLLLGAAFVYLKFWRNSGTNAKEGR